MQTRRGLGGMKCFPWFVSLPHAGAVHPGLSEKFTQMELLRVRIRTQVSPGCPSPAASGCHPVEKGPQSGGLGPRKTSSLPPLVPPVAGLQEGRTRGWGWERFAAQVTCKPLCANRNPHEGELKICHLSPRGTDSLCLPQWEGGFSLRFSFFNHVTTLVKFMERMRLSPSGARGPSQSQELAQLQVSLRPSPPWQSLPLLCLQSCSPCA